MRQLSRAVQPRVQAAQPIMQRLPPAHLRKLAAALGQSSTQRSTTKSPLLVSMMAAMPVRERWADATRAGAHSGQA